MKSKWLVYTKKADFKAIAKKYNIDQVIARVIKKSALNLRYNTENNAVNTVNTTVAEYITFFIQTPENYL